MATAVAGPEIEKLIQLLSKLPGLGPRSARRIALALIKRRETLLDPLVQTLGAAAEAVNEHQGAQRVARAGVDYGEADRPSTLGGRQA